MDETNPPRPIGRSVRRGLIGRCPNCCEGRLFQQFLKTAPACTSCGEPFHHHRADDFPAYVVMFIVGHLVVPGVVAVEVAYSPPIWLQLALWLPLTAALSLGLLQPVKGAIVGYQWALRMHGFSGSPDPFDPPKPLDPGMPDKARA